MFTICTFIYKSIAMIMPKNVGLKNIYLLKNYPIISGVKRMRESLLELFIHVYRTCLKGNKFHTNSIYFIITSRYNSRNLINTTHKFFFFIIRYNNGDGGFETQFSS